MQSPAHVTAFGAVLALAFGGTPIALLVRMLLLSRASADASQPDQMPGRMRLLLVPVKGDSESQRRVELASQSAKEQGARVLLVYVIEVPWTLPLDATLGQADGEARAALEEARLVVEQHRVPVRTVIRRARTARAGIAEAARDHRADLVFRAPRSRRGRRDGCSSPVGQ